jgi:hypothetical protein
MPVSRPCATPTIAFFTIFHTSRHIVPIVLIVVLLFFGVFVPFGGSLLLSSSVVTPLS